MRFRIFGRVVYVPSVFVAVAILVIVLIVAILGYVLSKDDNGIIISSTPEAGKTSEVASTAQTLISVHVIGCVNQRKVVRIPQGSTVEEAVEACGGFTNDADKDAVNLAFRVLDGMQIKIPSKDEADKNWIVSGGLANEDGKVSINNGTLEQLMKLPGVGESTAKSIIQYREKNNGFKNIEEIMQVPGIKQAKYDSLKDYIVL